MNNMFVIENSVVIVSDKIMTMDWIKMVFVLFVKVFVFAQDVREMTWL